MVVDRDVSTAYCWSSSGDDLDWLCPIISSTVAVGDWCISILAVVINDWRIISYKLTCMFTQIYSLRAHRENLQNECDTWVQSIDFVANLLKPVLSLLLSHS